MSDYIPSSLQVANKAIAEAFTAYVPVYHRTMNELMDEKNIPSISQAAIEMQEQFEKGQKRKADAMDDSDSKSSEGSEDSSDDEGESEVVYRTVKCPHCKRVVFKLCKFFIKLTVLVIAQLISNYLLCNQ